MFLLLYILYPQSFVASSIDGGIKYRPTAEELAEIGPAFTKRWNEYFANAPDKPVVWIGPVVM